MIKFEKVTKKFGNGVIAVGEIDLEIPDKEFIFITGPSGAGKTTLLRLLIRDLLPSSGAIFFNEWNLVKLPKKRVPHLRRLVGMVFQDYKLLLDRTIFENVALTLEIAGKKQKEINQKVKETLALVGLEAQTNLFPLQISGGELQRASIARALVCTPEVILADEPTGNLDPETSKEIMDLLEEINKMGTTIIMATHNMSIVDRMKKRVVTLNKGKVVRDVKEGKYEISSKSDRSKKENSEKSEEEEQVEGKEEKH